MPRSGVQNWLRRRWDLDAYFLFRADLTTAQMAPDYGEFTVHELERPNGPLFEQACSLQRRALQGEEGRAKSTKSVEAEFRTRWRAGDRCFVVVTAENVGAGLRWIAGARSKVFDGFAAYVRGVPNSALFTQAFVAPAYRGHRLQRLMDADMKRTLVAEGVKITYVFVGVRNLASIVNCHRCNDYYRLLYHVKVELPRGKDRHYYPKSDCETWRPCLASQ